MVADHFLVVIGARRLIIESSERNQTDLRDKFFRIYTGLESKNLLILDFLEVMAQEEVFNNNKQNSKGFIDFTLC